MTRRLTPEQESLVEEAVASGLANSAEEFVTDALRNQMDEATNQSDLTEWLRSVVVPAHREFLKDTSRGIPANELLKTIKARRKVKSPDN